MEELGRIGDYWCRWATADDVVAIYNMIEPKITTNEQSTVNESRRRTLNSLIPYYIQNRDCVVVEVNGVVKAVYMGNGNEMLHVVSIGGKKAFVLLMWVITNVLHDSTEGSVFRVINQFSNQVNIDKYCTKIADQVYVLNDLAKRTINYMYEKLNDKR